MTSFNYSGKVCLVTGSSRGIGAAILGAFVNAGANGVLHYWDDPAGANKKDAEALTAALGKNCTCPASRISADTGVQFFDAGSVAKTDPTDGGHLDAANTRAIGQALVPVVKKILSI